MSNPKDIESVSISLRMAQIIAKLADSKARHFANATGMAMKEVAALQAELENLRLRREEIRHELKNQTFITRRSQLAILSDRLESMGLAHLVEWSKEQAEQRATEIRERAQAVRERDA